MTVHGAKGLEFELVLLTGMEEDMFPYRGMQDARRRGDGRGAAPRVRRDHARAQAPRVTHARARQIFGTDALGSPSRFIGDLPHDVVEHQATRGASTESMRYFDTPARPAPRAGAFRDGELAHPQDVDPVFEGDEDEEVFPLRGAPPPSMPRRSSEVGGRYVDRDYFSDDEGSGDESRGLRRGAKVKHERFGEGVVRQVLPSRPSGGRASPRGREEGPRPIPSSALITS